MLETPPPAPPTSQHRSRFGRLGEQTTRDGSSDEFRRLDPVTGLRDARALWRELAQSAASCCPSSPLAVLVLDFDRLGELNERYDRSVGDAVLRRCAEVAALEAPSARLAFRYRDDELVVLVPGDEEDGREIGERMRDRIAAQNHTLPAITVSCGIAVLREPVEPLVAVGRGGPALQAAKQAGGNRVVVASELGRNVRNGHNGGDGDDGTARRAALAMAVASLEARDRETAAHSEDVVTLCESIGTRLGLRDEQLDRLAAAAQLHDVGKLAMPTEILNKPGALNDDEWDIIRQHTVIGERMLRAVPEMGAVAGMVRHSHERWDGGGYPDGLAGDEIPLASRIVLCADAFHAIRSDRPYRAGRSADAALAEVRAHAGTQFDPRVVDALVAVARDVRRAGMATTLPRARRLAALLAALIIFGGGSAYAASDEVRHAVDKVVRVITPGNVFQPEDADAADFSLRPMDQVSGITPVATITPDMEFPELRGTPLLEGAGQRPESAPASAVSGGRGYSTNEAVADVGNPVEQPEPKPPKQSEEPQASSPTPPAMDEGQLEPGVPIELVVIPPEPGVVPSLTPVPELEHVPTGAEPAAGHPHGGPPGQIKKDDDEEEEASEDVQPDDDEHAGRGPDEEPEHPHADGDPPPEPTDVVEEKPEHPHADDDAPPEPTDVVEDNPEHPAADEELPPEPTDVVEDNPEQPDAEDELPPGLTHVVEDNPEHPHADDDLPPGLTDVVEDKPNHPHEPTPSANVVTPAPSIAATTETIFVPPETAPTPPESEPAPTETTIVPPEDSPVPAPPVPAIRPPEYGPDELDEETPAS